MEPVTPTVQGKCDFCGGGLYVREDDHRSVIEARLEEYRIKSLPLLKVFDNMGLLVNFEPKRGVKDYEQMKNIVMSKLEMS